MKRIVWIVVAVAVVGAITVMSFLGGAIPVEMLEVSTATVRDYVADDAKTRLADEYIIDMPVSGTVERIQLEVGDDVEQGQVVARIDPYDLKQEIVQVEARIAQKKADVAGVDIAKPKDEDIESAKLRVTEMIDGMEIAKKTRAVVNANHREAELAFERAKGLLKAGAASQSFYDTAEVRYQGLEADRERTKLEEAASAKALEQAEIAYQRLVSSIDDNEYQRDSFLAEIEMLKSQLAMFQEDLGKTKIKAPVSGPVLERLEVDQRVLAAGTPLLKIGDMNSIEIECDVLSEEISAVRVGNKVSISGKALRGQELEGKVSRIYPSGFMKISALGVEQQRVRTIIAFNNETAGLRPGTSVDVEIITAEAKNAVAVPDRAVFRSNGGWAVFVVDGSKAVVTPIEVGLRNEDWAEVVSGLEAGVTIISELKNDLEDGVRVTPLD